MELPTDLTLRVGDRVSYPIAGAGSVGYRWQLDVRGATSSCEFRTGPIGPLPAGAPTGGSYPQALFITGLALGRCTIVLGLYREPTRPPRETHEIAVTVVGD